MNNLVKVVEEVNGGITFSDGTRLYDFHGQDCCESHWAEFSYVSIEDFEGMLFDISNFDFIEKVDGYGFRMVDVRNQKVSIPCYGSNNGYYSTDLKLVLGRKEERFLDISDCQEISWG